MKLFGNTKKRKYGSGATKRSSATEQSLTQTVTPESPSVPSVGRYTKKSTIFAYAQMEPAQRRQCMQADYRNTPVRNRKKSRHMKRMRWLVALLLLAVLGCTMYLVFRFSDIPFVASFREQITRQSMESMRFQWVGKIFIPEEWTELSAVRQKARQEQIGLISIDPPTQETQVSDAQEPDSAQNTEDPELLAREAFYDLFWELDQNSAEAYFRTHPEALKDGYENININKSGLDEDGTAIYTKMGERVLAINVEDGVLLVRLWIGNSRGVLAIAKDPSLLHLYPSKGIGGYGQHIEDIATNHNGILAITGSGFIDEGGHGTGGELAGFCRCDGESYGRHMGWGMKRIELKENNWFYINDAPASCDDDVTDAMEFEPALIVNGEQITAYDYTANAPRACIGQSKNGEILMLVVEGRFTDSPGCSVNICSDKMLEHDCITALNVDGGTSAIMWYDGQVVTRCSNVRTPEGRYLPNAWVYTHNER